MWIWLSTYDLRARSTLSKNKFECRPTSYDLRANFTHLYNTPIFLHFKNASEIPKWTADLIEWGFNAALSYVVMPLVEDDWQLKIGLAGVRTHNHLISSTRRYWQTIPYDDWIERCLFFTPLQLISSERKLAESGFEATTNGPTDHVVNNNKQCWTKDWNASYPK